MFYQLIQLPFTIDNSDEIVLDDRWHGSYAVYRLFNPDHLEVRYCSPDEANEGEPRCDYLLYIANKKNVRFVELKGADTLSKEYRCCKTTWAHGFHQLEATFDRYGSLLEGTDTPIFILCTALPRKRVAAHYKSYSRYKSLLVKTKGRVRVLFKEDIDTLDEEA